jgi:hypothetical protein
MRLKSNYATATIYGIYQVWTNFTRVPYKNDLLQFVTRIKAALAEVNMIRIDTKQSVVSMTIMEKITEKRPDMMEHLLADITTLSDPLLLLDKLCELANHEQVQRLTEAASRQSVALSTFSANNNNARGSNSSTSNSRGKQRRVEQYPCAPGAHNPESTTHSERNCWFLNPNYKKGGKDPSKSATSHHTSTDSSDKPPKDYAYITGLKADHNSIVLDSGASQHMFNSMAYFIEAKPASVYIITGSGAAKEELTATHRGTARVAVGNTTITLRNALFVPRLTTNLVLFALMVQESAYMQRTGNLVEMKLNGNHSLTVNTRCDIFELEDVKPANTIALMTTSVREVSSMQKWHNLFGHASSAQSKGALDGQRIDGTIHCDVCLQGKMTKAPFKGHFTPTSNPLEVAHGDLVGPIHPATNGGCRYFLTLVDQHTGFIHIALLKEKSNATKQIAKFKTLYEKQTGYPIRKLVTDGGGEFCNKVLSGILKRDGIQHNVAPPYTPQHNGMAERANHTIIEMIRCMMI